MAAVVFIARNGERISEVMGLTRTNAEMRVTTYVANRCAKCGARGVKTIVDALGQKICGLCDVTFGERR